MQRKARSQTKGSLRKISQDLGPGHSPLPPRQHQDPQNGVLPALRALWYSVLPALLIIQKSVLLALLVLQNQILLVLAVL